MKPAYRVPTMPEVAALPWNGLSVISTFAGCGGSSLGYRMAGYRVVWASEFVPAAQDSYRANMAEGTILDGRDVREVTAGEILAATGLGVGQLDVLDGSPPCQAFSTAGKRERGWGEERSYAHGAKQKNEDLFAEFVRLRDGLMPRAFVAENVSGLVKGAAKGYFLEILRALKRGYRVEARLLDAQWLGVPQTRQRIIFVGFRDDMGVEPAFPAPLPYRYSVRDALPWLGRVFHDTSGLFGSGDVLNRPSPTITVGMDSINSCYFKVQDAAIVHRAQPRNQPWGAEVARRSIDEPSVSVTENGYGGGNRSQYAVEIVGRSKRSGQRTRIDEPHPTVIAGTHGSGPHEHQVEVRKIGHHDVVPDNVGASIDGYAIGAEYDKLNPGGQSEKFFSLLRADAGQPCPTITSSGGGKSGDVEAAPGGVACVCHPTERRKFTIAELRRICSFPDDFVLTGTYAQQWERLGNSVPPLMMRAVAEVVRDQLLKARAASPPGRPRPSKRKRGRSRPRRGKPATEPTRAPRSPPR